MRGYFFIIFVFITACSTSEKAGHLNGLSKASYFAEKYGQIVSTKEIDYFKYLQNRLNYSLNKSSGKNYDFHIVLLNTSRPIATYAGSNIILISKGIIKSVNTEAELAFILAHEMAHKHLNHKLMSDESDYNEAPAEQENEADKLAVAIISASGYDPRYAINSLRNTYTAAAKYISDTSNYPDLNKRIELVSDYINQMQWLPPGTITRREFKDIKSNLP